MSKDRDAGSVLASGHYDLVPGFQHNVLIAFLALVHFVVIKLEALRSSNDDNSAFLGEITKPAGVDQRFHHGSGNEQREGPGPLHFTHDEVFLAIDLVDGD